MMTPFSSEHTDIDRLVSYLDLQVPLTSSFVVALSKVVQDQLAVHKQGLLDPPARCGNIWFLLSGIVVASIFDSNGKEVVVKIYLPETVFTDFDSFSQQKSSAVKLTAIGHVKLQRILHNDYKIFLKQFSETSELRERILLKDLLLDQQRSRLISLKNEQRFEEFASAFPVNLLPNIVGASFLYMHRSKYCELKAKWNLTNRFRGS
ncbi:MAG TPA: hypothetical protein VKB19_16135 [Pedobacter sp.]|nr:hypothetical protein [Pedobacter sp.]